MCGDKRINYEHLLATTDNHYATMVTRVGVEPHGGAKSRGRALVPLPHANPGVSSPSHSQLSHLIPLLYCCCLRTGSSGTAMHIGSPALPPRASSCVLLLIHFNLFFFYFCVHVAVLSPGVPMHPHAFPSHDPPPLHQFLYYAFLYCAFPLSVHTAFLVILCALRGWPRMARQKERKR